MDSNIMVESLPLLGTCSLCLTEGVVQSMLVENKYNNKTESYTKMLLKCFAIDMSAMDLDDTKRLICNKCSEQLQECLKFREQVELSLKALEATLRLKKADLQAVEDCVKDEDTPLNIGYDEDDDLDADEHAMDRIKDETSDINLTFHDNDLDSNRVMRRVTKVLNKVMGMRMRTGDDIHTDGENILLKNVKQESMDDSDIEDHILLKDLIIKKERKEYRTRRRKKLPSTKKRLGNKKLELQETEKLLESGLFPFKIGKNLLYSCTICQEKSACLDDIKSHVKEHGIKNIQAAFRKMVSSNLQSFYKDTTKFRCKRCKIDICDYDELKHHINVCIKLNSNRWNTLPFKLEKDQLDCPICQKTFLNFVSLNTHMNVHYPNHICDTCGKAFASKARLRGHMRTHEVGDFPCRYCDAVFDKVTKRENHVSKEHKSGIRYACKRCNISLSSFYARQKHLAEVHNEELKRYKCKACPQSYITPGHLSSHVRRDHLNERNHKCSKCDLAFYTRNSLKMHMIKHDGERIHTCNICTKSYQRKKTLREHMRIHDNDKRFICPVCGRAFTQKCTLKGHLKVHERKVDLDDRIPPPLHSI